MSKDSIDDTNFVSNVGKRRLKSLVLPTRKKKKAEPEVPVLTEKLTAPKKFYECPMCSEIMYEPYPAKVNRLIKKLEKNKKQYEAEQRAKYDEETAELRRDKKPVPPFAFIPPGMSQNDKKFFCRTHRTELEFKPMAKERNYPEHIDFEAIPDRIAFIENDLKAIIDRKAPSTFLDNALKRYEELGLKARNTSELMKVFKDFMPGYYGNKGLDYIMDALNDMFLQSEYLTKEKADPLTPVDYIQQILVPECGVRLIQEDRGNKITLEEAATIMKESEEYGSVVYFKSKTNKLSAQELATQELSSQDIQASQDIQSSQEVQAAR